MGKSLANIHSGSCKRFALNIQENTQIIAQFNTLKALKSQVKQKEPSKQKKSRRHRRKPSNLLSEYSRRQRKHAWLETHIWHAKRFKMVEQWGYKIPLHPNDKSVRASYRAMANGCLLQVMRCQFLMNYVR
jgi:predicted RNase H-like nuclease (RuvC/YqgF family)